jgi:hypothetical protein
VVVSDFYTRHYFDPVTLAGVRYSYTGALMGPREVLRDGYLSWHEPVSDHWWQLRFFGAKQEFVDLGVFTAMAGSVRSTIDVMTPRRWMIQGVGGTDRRLVVAAGAQEEASQSTSAKAAAWREQIQALKAGSLADLARKGGGG